MSDKIKKTLSEWQEVLTPEEFAICRKKGTERAFSGEYNNTKTAGTYKCTCCGEPLFTSRTKYDSGSGWPSFWRAVSEDAIGQTLDASHGMVRTEIHCAKCDSHLGHVFDDGPKPTGLRYCVNSISLKLDADD